MHYCIILENDKIKSKNGYLTLYDKRLCHHIQQVI